MRHATLDILQDEHQALAAMLRSLSMLLAQARRENTFPDFDVVRAMLFYVDEFPEKLHHSKESELLFPVLRGRCPDLAPVLDRLDRDHANSEKAIRALEHQLLAFEVLGESRREAFEEGLQQYIASYLEHMDVEEREVLPVARRELSADDWALLDAAFSQNKDPLTGHEPSAEFKPLFRKIVMSVPAPIGLGPPH